MKESSLFYIQCIFTYAFTLLSLVELNIEYEWEGGRKEKNQHDIQKIQNIHANNGRSLKLYEIICSYCSRLIWKRL